MAKKTTKKAEEIQVATVEAPVVETAPASEPSKLIVCKPKGDRYFVYFRGVLPENNVCCGCKSPQKAINYMFLLKKRHNAVISKEHYDALKALVENEKKEA